MSRLPCALALALLALAAPGRAPAQGLSMTEFEARRRQITDAYIAADTPAAKRALLDEFRALDLAGPAAPGPGSDDLVAALVEGGRAVGAAAGPGARVEPVDEDLLGAGASRVAATTVELAAAAARLQESWAHVQGTPYPTGGGHGGPPVALQEAHLRIRDDFVGRTPITDAEREWLYHWMRGSGFLHLLNALGEPGNDGLDPRRAVIVAIALGQVGRVEARRRGETRSIPGHDREVPWRIGADVLHEYFLRAGCILGAGGRLGQPGVTSVPLVYDVRKPVGPDAQGRNLGIPSWCGIFALAVQKMAGNATENWPDPAPWNRNIGTIGPGKWERLDPGREMPKPGDIVLRSQGQHHGIVVRAVPEPGGGFRVVTVDGNYAFASAVVVHEEDSSFWNGYFRAFPEGS